jgi:hypothetical protein
MVRKRLVRSLARVNSDNAAEYGGGAPADISTSPTVADSAKNLFRV